MSIFRGRIKEIDKNIDTMEKIQELTDKLYREGVEKGAAEGHRLVEQAQAEAARLMEDARKEAESIVAKARRQAQETEENTKSELRLYAGQALEALKSEIVNVMSDKLVSDTVDGLLTDKDFMGSFMVALARNWADGGGLVISAADAAGLTAYFKAKAKNLLDKGVRIEKVNGKEAAFSVAPADGAYKVNFGKDEFEAYFKEFLRPKLVEMLF